jgi:hypothetical protein
MATALLHMSPLIELAYKGLPPAAKREFEFDCAFRLGQMKRAHGTEKTRKNIGFLKTVRTMQEKAKKNGSTETVISTLLTELGHAT